MFRTVIKKSNYFEILIVALSFLGYGLLGLLFSFNTALVFHPKYICDLYFGFDNLAHDTSLLRHPILKLLSLSFNKLFNTFQDPLLIAIIITSICSLLLAIQNLVLYKILKRVLKLDDLCSLLIVFIFSISGYNLLQSFTFDSYVFSSTVLLSFFYLYYKFENNRSILSRKFLFLNTFLAVTITISNAFKVFIIYLIDFNKTNLSLYLKRLFLAFLGFFLLGILFYDQIKKTVNFTLVYFGQYNDFLKDCFYFLWGSIFVIPKVSVVNDYYINGELFYHVVGTYQDAGQTFILLLIAIIFSYIVIINWRQKLTRILLSLFAVDFFIFGVLGFGLHEAYIFPGNYQFIFPLLLGVHFAKHKMTRLHFILLIPIILMILTFNILELIKLFEFGLLHYPR